MDEDEVAEIEPSGNGKIIDLGQRLPVRRMPRASELSKEFWGIPSDIENRKIIKLYSEAVSELRAETLEMGMTSVADMMLVQHVVYAWVRLRDMELKGNTGTSKYQSIERSWISCMGQLRAAQLTHANPFEMARHVAMRLNSLIDELDAKGLLVGDAHELRRVVMSYAQPD